MLFACIIFFPYRVEMNNSKRDFGSHRRGAQAEGLKNVDNTENTLLCKLDALRHQSSVSHVLKQRTHELRELLRTEGQTMRETTSKSMFSPVPSAEQLEIGQCLGHLASKMKHKNSRLSLQNRMLEAQNQELTEENNLLKQKNSLLERELGALSVKYGELRRIREHERSMFVKTLTAAADPYLKRIIAKEPHEAIDSPSQQTKRKLLEERNEPLQINVMTPFARHVSAMDASFV